MDLLPLALTSTSTHSYYILTLLLIKRSLLLLFCFIILIVCKCCLFSSPPHFMYFLDIIQSSSVSSNPSRIRSYSINKLLLSFPFFIDVYADQTSSRSILHFFLTANINIYTQIKSLITRSTRDLDLLFNYRANIQIK